MSESNDKKPQPMRRRTDHKTLESWKAIANYLNRSVRTVRRWETHEGLPVHRHKHTRGSSVYAYCSELDEWRGRHRQPQYQPHPVESTGTSGVTVRYAALAVAAAALAVLTWNISWNPGADPSPGSDAWVLVAKAANESGADDVTENFEAALRREILGIKHRHALPQHRIQEALMLMRLDPATALEPAVARNVALRDGQVSALLLPHIEQVGDVYVFSAEIVDPHSGAVLAYPSENAAGLDTALAAIERLSDRVGSDLSRLPETTRTAALPRVTTSSINALELYAQAETMLREDLPAAARELLRLAVTQDPEFASAMALQAWASRRAGDSVEDYLPVAENAAELGGSLPLRERYFVQGSYNLFAGNSTRASSNFRTLVEIEPDHLLGRQAMLELCDIPGTAINCTETKVLLAERRPQHFDSNLDAAWALAAEGRDADLTAHFAGRMQTLLLQGHSVISPESAARALMFPIIRAWTEGNLQEAMGESERLQASLPTLATDTRHYVLRNLIAHSLALGRLQQARGLVDQIESPAQRHELRAMLLFASGDKTALKGHLASGGNYEEQFTALLLSMAGLAEQATALNNDLQKNGMNAGQGGIVRAMIALVGGQPQTAKTELQAIVDNLRAEDEAYYFVGPDMLAKILEAEGELTAALSMLETTAPRRLEAAYNNSAVFWMMCQRQLAKLYREAGREREADRIENNLRELLIHADDDFPLAQSLQEA